ncbi:hypothetical protein [Pseudomonas monsensis]
MNSQDGASSVNNAGDLDPTFGVDGVVNVPIASGTLRCMVEDNQGSIVHGLWVGNEMWFYRIFANGSQDLQFGSDGVTRWEFAPGKLSVPVQLLQQTDGKYVVIGALRDDRFDQRPKVAITRFNSNGTPDLVFGNKILPLPAQSNLFTEFPSYGCLQADGKILVAASYTLVDGQDQLVLRSSRLHRLQANGEADLEFGGGRGFVEVLMNGQNTEVKSVVVTRDGKIVVGGTTERVRVGSYDRKQSVARFLSNGALDDTFGRNGYWEADGNNVMGRVIFLEDKLIVVGYEVVKPSGYRVCVSRLTADGEFDPTFNNGIRLLTDVPMDVPGYTLICNAVALQADGKIIAAGYAGFAARAYWLRIQTNGQLDPDFGDQGLHVHEPSNLMGGVLVQTTTGRILAAIDSAVAPAPRILGILA